MSKVLKGILAVIFLLIVGVIILNFHLGNVIKEYAREGLEYLNKDEVLLQYEKITARPITRKITLERVSFFDESITNYFCEEIVLTLSWDQMISMIKNEETEALKKMDILAKKVFIVDEDISLKIGTMAFSFSGLINEEIIDGNTGLLLKTPQKLSFAITDIDIDSIELMEEVDINLSIITNIDKISFDLAYNPDNKTVEIEDFNIKNKIIDIKGLSSCEFIGDEIDFILPGIFTLNVNGNIDGSNIDFTEDEYGYLAFKNIDFKVDFEMDLSLPGTEVFPVATVDTKITDIEYRFPDETKYYLSLMGVISSDTDKIDITDFSYNIDMNEEDLCLHSTLKSSLFDLKVELDMLNDTYDPYINSSSLEISNLSSDGENLVNILEVILEQSLSRDNQGNIVIEYSGYLSEF